MTGDFLSDIVSSVVISLSKYFIEIQQGLLSLPVMSGDSSLTNTWNFVLFLAAIAIIALLTLNIYKWIFSLQGKGETIPAFFIKAFLVLVLIFGFVWFNDYVWSLLLWTPQSIEVESKPDSRYIVKTIYPNTAIKINNRAVQDYTYSYSPWYSIPSLTWWTINNIKKGTMFPSEFMSLQNSSVEVPIPLDTSDSSIKYCPVWSLMSDDKKSCYTINSKGWKEIVPDSQLKSSSDITNLAETLNQTLTYDKNNPAPAAWFPLKVIQTLPQWNNWKDRYSYAMIWSYYDELLNDSCLKDFPIPKEILDEINTLEPFNIEQTHKEANANRIKQITDTWKSLWETRLKSQCYPNDLRLQALFAAKNIVDAFDWKTTDTTNQTDKKVIIDSNSPFLQPDDKTKETTCYNWKTLKPECANQYKSCKMILSWKISGDTFKECLQNDIFDTTNALTADTANNFTFSWIPDLDSKVWFVIPVPKGVDWWFVTQGNPDTSIWTYIKWTVIIVARITVWVIVFIACPLIWWAVIWTILSISRWITSTAIVFLILHSIDEYISWALWWTTFEYKKLNREPYLASVYSYDLDWNMNVGQSWYENTIWLGINNEIKDNFTTVTFDINEFNAGVLNLYSIQSACSEILKGWDVIKSTSLIDYFANIPDAKSYIWLKIAQNGNICNGKNEYDCKSYLDSLGSPLKIWSLCPSLNNYSYTAIQKQETLKYFKRDLFPYEINYIVNPIYNVPLTYWSPTDWSYSAGGDGAGALFDKYLESYLDIQNSTWSVLSWYNWWIGTYWNWKYDCLRTVWSFNPYIAKKNYNCIIGDYNRLMDVRLNPYKQDMQGFSSMLSSALWSNQQVDTHVSIPIITADWQTHSFTIDRRNMWFANEAKPVINSIGINKAEWLKITEGDVFAVKPWSIIWAYSAPYKIIYDERLEPWISFVELNSMNPIPNPETNTKIYSNWLYHALFAMLDQWSFWKDLETQLKTAKQLWPQNEEDVLNNYIDNLYTSRPDQLKQTEWKVIDWLFDPFYWFGYTRMGNTSFLVENLFSVWRFVTTIAFILIFLVYLFAALRYKLLFIMVAISPLVFVYLILSWNHKNIVRLAKFFQLYASLILFSFFFLISITLIRLWLWFESSTYLLTYRDISYFLWISFALLFSIIPSYWITYRIWKSNFIWANIEIALNATHASINEMWTVGANQDYMKGFEKMKKDSKDMWPTKIQKLWANASDQFDSISTMAAWKNLWNWFTSRLWKDVSPINNNPNVINELKSLKNKWKNIIGSILWQQFAEKLWLKEEELLIIEENMMNEKGEVDFEKAKELYDSYNTLSIEDEKIKTITEEEKQTMTEEELLKIEQKVMLLKNKEKVQEIKRKQLDVILSKVSNKELKQKFLDKLKRWSIFAHQGKLFSEEMLEQENNQKGFASLNRVLSTLKSKESLSAEDVYTQLDDLLQTKGIVWKDSKNINTYDKIRQYLGYWSLENLNIKEKDGSYNFWKIEGFAWKIKDLKFAAKNQDLMSVYLNKVHSSDLKRKAYMDQMILSYLSILEKTDKTSSDNYRKTYEDLSKGVSLNEKQRVDMESFIWTVLSKKSKNFIENISWKSNEFISSYKKLEAEKYYRSINSYGKSINWEKWLTNLANSWFWTKYFVNEENYELIMENMMATKSQDENKIKELKEYIESLKVQDKLKYTALISQINQVKSYPLELQDKMISSWNMKERELYNMSNKEMFSYMVNQQEFKKLKKKDKDKYMELEERMNKFMTLSAIEKNELLFKHWYNVSVTEEQNKIQESMIINQMNSINQKLLEGQIYNLEELWNREWMIKQSIDKNKYIVENVSTKEELTISNIIIENMVKNKIYKENNIDEVELLKLKKFMEQKEKDKNNNMSGSITF